jgi:hypothetical protein
MFKQIRFHFVSGIALVSAFLLTFAVTGTAGTKPQVPGRILTNDQRLNDDTGTANQFAPALAMHPNGLSVAVWPDGRNGGSDIYYQLYNRRGQPFGSLGNVKVNDASHAGPYMSCDVAMDGYGHFLVVWDGGSAGSSHVYRQWYLANGKPIGGNHQVDEAEGSLINAGAAVAGFDSGGAVVVWTDRRTDAQGDLAFQRFDQFGARLGENVMVDPASTSAQMGGAVDADAHGRFVVAWQEGQPGSRIMVRRFDAEGLPTGASFQVAPQADPTVLSFAMPALAVLENGGFAVLWMADYGAGEIRRQACLYDSNAQAVTGVFRVDEPGKFAYAGEVAATAFRNDFYIFAWSGNEAGDWNIYGRYCSASGVMFIGMPVNDLPGRQMGPDVAVGGINTAIFAWYDNRNGDLDIYGTRLGPDIPASVTAGAGFDGKVPLTWEPSFGEEAGRRYQIMRAENMEDEPLVLATVDVSTRLLPERMLDFVDTTAENGRSYYYGVQPEAGGAAPCSRAP